MAVSYTHLAQDSKASYVIGFQDLGKLIRIIDSIQLGAADQGNPVFAKLPVEIGISIGGAVGRNQQIRVVKIGSLGGSQFELHGPLILSLSQMFFYGCLVVGRGFPLFKGCLLYTSGRLLENSDGA